MWSLIGFVCFFLLYVGLFALVLYLLGAAIKKQANKEEKRFFAPIPRPGTFSFVTLEGKVVNIIESVVGWHLEEIKSQSGAKCFKIGPKEEREDFFGYILEHYLGVVWVGLFRTIRTFPDWKWIEFRQVGTGYEVTARDAKKEEKLVDSFFFQFPYPVVLEDAEIEGNIRVKIVAVFTVLHIHPIRAFFLNKDPIALFNAMVLSALRDYVRDKSFDEVKGTKASSTAAKTSGTEKREGEDLTFWEVLETLNGIKMKDNGDPDYEKTNPLGLFGKLGYMIVRGEILQIEPFGKAADALEAARLADLEGQAEIVAAEKTAKAAIVTANGRLKAAKRDALAQRRLNEQTAGYFASLPDGARMYVAHQLASEDSDVTTWVEGGSKTGVTLPLPPAPPKRKEPKKIKPIEPSA